MTSNAPVRTLLALLLAFLFTSCTEGSFVEPSTQVVEEILFSLSPVGLSIAVGETAAVNATIANAGGKPVNPQSLKWESSAPPVATVDSDGNVTGVAPGEALVVARSGSREDTTLVLVTEAPPAEAGVRISPQVAELAWIGAGGTLTAQAHTEDGTLVANPGITWTSLDPDIVEVNSVGELTASKLGKALIVAACAACAAADTVEAQVYQDVDTVQVFPSSPSLDAGDSLQLNAVAFDRGGTDIEGVSFTWSSSQPAVAEVSGSGIVMARSDGSAEIRATTESHTGKSGVTVGEGGSDVAEQAPDFTSAVQKWNDNFFRYGDLHWANEVAEGGTRHNYYDRAAIWARRGLIDRADYTAQTFVDQMVFGAGADDTDASMAPRNWAGEGVMQYALRKGGFDGMTKGQNPAWAAYSMAVEMTFDWAYSGNGMTRVKAGEANWEGRISERALLAPLLAHIYGLPAPPQSRNPSSGAPTPATWAEAARHTLDLILPQMTPEGRWPHPGTGRTNANGEALQINYMVAILLDALTRYYEEFEPDPRIPDVVQRSVDYLWETQWMGTGFPYYDNADPDGLPHDLNLLFVSAWGFVYKMTGDTRYRDQGDRIFTEGVNRSWINQVGAVKQFNQQYRSAHRYLERTQ